MCSCQVRRITPSAAKRERDRRVCIGQWLVKEGQETAFLAKWREWLEWTRDNVSGFRWAKLMRSADENRRFLSPSLWENEKARTDWKTLEGFRQGFAAAKALCDEFHGGDYNIEVEV